MEKALPSRAWDFQSNCVFHFATSTEMLVQCLYHATVRASPDFDASAIIANPAFGRDHPRARNFLVVISSLNMRLTIFAAPAFIAARRWTRRFARSLTALQSRASCLSEPDAKFHNVSPSNYPLYHYELNITRRSSSYLPRRLKRNPALLEMSLRANHNH